MNNYDKTYGPQGSKGWRGDVGEARNFLKKALGAESTSECLEDEDFIHPYKSEEELWPETREEAWAREEKRQELFNDAKEWPLVSVVCSAVYKILTDKIERFGFVGNFTWSELFWLLLAFKEQVFDMIEAKGWNNLCRKEIREGFRRGLSWSTKDFRGYPIRWGDGWFKRRYVNTKIYPQDVLRCLRLAGVDEETAGLAVNQVFKSQSLIPFYEALSDDVTITSIASILPSEKDQNFPHSEGKNLIGSITALFGVAAFLFCLSCRRIPTPITKGQVTIAEVSMGQNPYFAAIRMGGINTRRPGEENQDHSPARALHRASPQRRRKMQNLQDDSSTHSSQPDEDHFLHFFTKNVRRVLHFRLVPNKFQISKFLL